MCLYCTYYCERKKHKTLASSLVCVDFLFLKWSMFMLPHHKSGFSLTWLMDQLSAVSTWRFFCYVLLPAPSWALRAKNDCLVLCLTRAIRCLNFWLLLIKRWQMPDTWEDVKKHWWNGCCLFSCCCVLVMLPEALFGLLQRLLMERTTHIGNIEMPTHESHFNNSHVNYEPVSSSCKIFATYQASHRVSIKASSVIIQFKLLLLYTQRKQWFAGNTNLCFALNGFKLNF